MFKILLILFSTAVLIFPQKTPENIIIFIGDGMGLNYVAANIFQDSNNPFQKFTTTGLSITSSADRLITDSGAGATAIATGYRSYNLAIGVDTNRNPLTNIMELARELGKSTGIVSTSSVTHATPASFAAHVNERKLEVEIAEQMAESGTHVVIGGGLGFYTPIENSGKREKGDDLTASLKNKGFNLYTSVDQLRNSKKDKPFYALLELEALKPAGERAYDLKELVTSAIEYLSRDNDGFVLMVEGSQIDWAAHDHKTAQLFREMADFSGAVNAALDFAEKEGNTLVVVTSDHETGGGSIVKGQPDGTELEVKYTSDSHTPAMVGVFARGEGEEVFTGIQRINEIGRKLFRLLKPDYSFK